jgi:hypothetical protein
MAPARYLLNRLGKGAAGAEFIIRGALSLKTFSLSWTSRRPHWLGGWPSPRKPLATAQSPPRPPIASAFSGCLPSSYAFWRRSPSRAWRFSRAQVREMEIELSVFLETGDWEKTALSRTAEARLYMAAVERSVFRWRAVAALEGPAAPPRS